jgi:hypothetical protein
MIPGRPDDTFGTAYSNFDVTDVNFIDDKGGHGVRSSTNTFEADYGMALSDIATLPTSCNAFAF